MRVEIDTESGTMRINGVECSLAALDMITNPDPLRYFRFLRHGDVVVVDQFMLNDGDRLMVVNGPYTKRQQWTTLGAR